jgi:hypothetical protein
MDHDIMPSRHWFTPDVIPTSDLALDQHHGDGTLCLSLAFAPGGPVKVDVVPRLPNSRVNTAVSRTLRGGIPR